MNDFELEKEYLSDVEKILQQEVEKNNSQIKIYKDEYQKNYVDYADKTTAPEVRKFLSGLLKRLTNSVNYLYKENYRYGKVKYSPYFAKINLVDNGEDVCYYIGTKHIANDEKLAVIDWRTPICSLFYNSKLGNTSYTAPSGEIFVELKGKRQFKIENAKLINYYDVNENYCDDMLRESLDKSSSPYMKNIVATLQSEQDTIIRQDAYSSVVVNGIAGSGKTSIGMHRVAYLLYRDRENLSNENVLIISPNKLFTEYISHLLPELGEENVTTKSITDVFNECMIDIGYTKEKNAMVENIISGNKARYEECSKKYKYDFFEKLNNFIINYNSVDRIKSDLIIRKIIIPVEKLREYYFKPNQNDIKKSIDITADRIISEYFYKNNNSTQQKIKEQIISYFYKRVFTDDIVAIYKQFLQQNGFSTNICDKNVIYFEDMSALVYIKLKLFGIEQNHRIKQIFIDEMQDYDATSIVLLKEIFPKANFTMVGDYEQNLLFADNNSLAISKTFQSAKFFNLTTNYRSTSNISKFACKIVNKTYRSSFVREGEEPKIEYTKDIVDNINKIKNLILSLQKKYERIAIICKSNDEVKLYEKYLTNCYTLTENRTSINIEKPILTSVYYSKGLEFDAVILPNVSNEMYNGEIDKNILYIASTRAMQELEVYYIGEKSKLIDF